jgi:hypothetical protein
LLGRRNWWPSTLWRQGEPVDIAAFTPQAPAPPLQTTSPR